MKEKAPVQTYACPKLWESMEGSETTRFCESCGHHVHNLSLLDPETRRQLLAKSRSERVCGIFFKDLEGNLVTAESESELAKKMRLIRRAAITAGAIALSSCASRKEEIPLPGIYIPYDGGK